MNGNMQAQLDELKRRLAVVHDLQAAASVLHWDMSTYMPPGGSQARGRQLATLGRLAHEHATDAAIGALLDHLERWAEELPPDSDDAALIRVARRDYELASKLPSDLVEELEVHTAQSYTAWTTARSDNDFARMSPLLERTLELKRRYAQALGPADHIADRLIDQSDEGMTVATVRTLFTELRERLVPLVRAIAERPNPSRDCLRGHFPEAEQRRFGEAIITALGYDFARGRQDKTHHPFMTRFSSGDVRITTRFREDDLGDGLFSTIHETGHALYEQGVAPRYEGTPLAGGASTGVHESQSRLWENVVARGRPFWTWAFPRLQAAFPSQLADVTLAQFYRAINRVEPSLIRVDADEVTYNLHVMIRFELELELLEGTLAVKDLPERWHERYHSDLGVAAPDDRDGVLQDVHWFAGAFGYFQGYTLGNVLSAQIFASAVWAHPTIPDELARGEFSTLHTWLRDNLYRCGRKYPVPALVERVTGGPLSIEAYGDYLERKYGELYGL